MERGGRPGQHLSHPARTLSLMKGTPNMSALLLKLVNGYKTYSSAILAVVSGLGLVLAQNYSGGVTQIFQALLLLFGGASVVGMRHAIAKLDAKVQAQGATVKAAH